MDGFFGLLLQSGLYALSCIAVFLLEIYLGGLVFGLGLEAVADDVVFVGAGIAVYAAAVYAAVAVAVVVVAVAVVVVAVVDVVAVAAAVKLEASCRIAFAIVADSAYALDLGLVFVPYHRHYFELEFALEMAEGIAGHDPGHKLSVVVVWRDNKSDLSLVAAVFEHKSEVVAAVDILDIDGLAFAHNYLADLKAFSVLP
jgi:hypothetical protein